MITPAHDDAASSNPARKRTKTRPAARRRTIENTYDDPALRERLKAEIRAAAKGGEPGTWSARKSQLLTLAYQKLGGGYLQLHPNSKPQNVPKQSEKVSAKSARQISSPTPPSPVKTQPSQPAATKKEGAGKKKLTAVAATPPTELKRV
ncbi:MAG: hypothetical protein ACRYG7_36355 [Janthinobacterium lividum]